MDFAEKIEISITEKASKFLSGIGPKAAFFCYGWHKKLQFSDMDFVEKVEISITEKASEFLSGIGPKGCIFLLWMALKASLF